ncbi:efflux RND transporter periplasmic adaptor subunit [Culturomica sp.]|uniref:efflux RND transporter periplasmic adaptor subunit n=1 Tax=Culturomica sp. TaxID=1926652 RepID=UPI000E8F67A5|nr:efflux RND transporter periplasmic adaptor subunit [Culturomica sp.]HBO25997.1 efflux transporter periplasmic adaptor subunit [Culturomica sp.]
MKKYIFIILTLSVTLMACNNKPNNEKASSSAELHAQGDGHEHGDEIFFSKEQSEAVGLVVQSIKPELFHEVIRTSGQIQAAQGDEATVVATTNGIVSFPGQSVIEGSAVTRGGTIVTVSAKNLYEGDPVAKAKIAYETALKELKRSEGLIKDKIISAKEFEQTRMRYENARTVYEAQAANVTVAGVKVTSPISGYVKSRLVGEGEYVSVGQPVAVIAQNKRLQLRADVSENYFNALRKITNANFVVSYNNEVYKLSDLNGRLLSFGKASDKTSFYIPVIFEFDNRGDIIPGSYVEVFLLATPENDVLSIPTSALTEEQGVYFVYIQVGEEEFLKREIVVGASNGEKVRVLSGLKPGDKIVIKGAYQVKLAANSSVVPEGHDH